MRFFPRAAASHLKCFTTLVKYTFECSIPTCFQRLIEQPSRGSNKGMTCPIFLIPRLLADKHNL